MTTKLRVKVKDRWYTVEVGDLDSDPVIAKVDGDLVEVNIERLSSKTQSGSPKTDQMIHKLSEKTSDPEPYVGDSGLTSRSFMSPMPGIIVSVAVKVGDQVVTGDEICVLEAMKMQQVLRADWSGIVSEVHVSPGQQVFSGDPILEL